MTYQTVAMISQSLTLVFFMAFFIGVVVYAFWPGNKDRFDRAARDILDNDNATANREGHP